MKLKKTMISKNLTAASTKPIILGILKQGNSYGYLIIKKIKELSDGRMKYSDGMLYPVLHRLEKDGLIQSSWTLEDGARPRKYYEITAAGKEALAMEAEQWSQVNAVLNQLWQVKSTNP
jgi:DNA-binding PadR family transcriptional regulator